MRGSERESERLFSYIRLEEQIAADHPLRAIRALTNEVLAALSPRFEAPYSHLGRPSIPPEYLLRATLLQAFFSVRSERQLMEQIDYNLLFRWFVGLSIDDEVWAATVFTKNRDRLLEAQVAQEFLSALMSLPKVRHLLSSDHFSLDGTLITAWASIKSFRPEDGSGESPTTGRNGERNFHREKRSNETHASTTDADARLYRKGDDQASRLCYMGHALMENRHGLAVGAEVTTGTAERDAGLALVKRQRRERARRITLGADKAYDVSGFVGALRAEKVTPHIAIDGHVRVSGKPRKSAIDGRTTRHPGYAVSQRKRKRIEEIIRLDQGGGRCCPGEGPRPRKGQGRLHLRDRGLQPPANPEAPAAGRYVMAGSDPHTRARRTKGADGRTAPLTPSPPRRVATPE